MSYECSFTDINSLIEPIMYPISCTDITFNLSSFKPGNDAAKLNTACDTLQRNIVSHYSTTRPKRDFDRPFIVRLSTEVWVDADATLLGALSKSILEIATEISLTGFSLDVNTLNQVVEPHVDGLIKFSIINSVYRSNINSNYRDKRLCDLLQSMPHLKYLRLCFYDSKYARLLNTFFQPMTRIEELTIECHGDPGHMAGLVSKISKNTKRLNLIGFLNGRAKREEGEIDSITCVPDLMKSTVLIVEITKMLRRCTNLQKLTLDDVVHDSIHVEDGTTEKFMSALQGHETLQNLVFLNNSVKDPFDFVSRCINNGYLCALKLEYSRRNINGVVNEMIKSKHNVKKLCKILKKTNSKRIEIIDINMSGKLKVYSDSQDSSKFVFRMKTNEEIKISFPFARPDITFKFSKQETTGPFKSKLIQAAERDVRLAIDGNPPSYMTLQGEPGEYTAIELRFSKEVSGEFFDPGARTLVMAVVDLLNKNEKTLTRLRLRHFPRNNHEFELFRAISRLEKLESLELPDFYFRNMMMFNMIMPILKNLRFISLNGAQINEFMPIHNLIDLLRLRSWNVLEMVSLQRIDLSGYDFKQRTEEQSEKLRFILSDDDVGKEMLFKGLREGNHFLTTNGFKTPYELQLRICQFIPHNSQ